MSVNHMECLDFSAKAATNIGHNSSLPKESSQSREVSDAVFEAYFRSVALRVYRGLARRARLHRREFGHCRASLLSLNAK